MEMYMNACQKYIAELLDEYGPLLSRQLLAMVNFKFSTKLTILDGYILQMCKFSDFIKLPTSKDIILARKGDEPDYDIIRSFDVMIRFFPNVVWHRRTRTPETLRFLTSTVERDKEICVIPVRCGDEKRLSAYATDKYDDECELAIFLLDDKEQMKKLNVQCNRRFAVFEKGEVVFYK